MPRIKPVVSQWILVLISKRTKTQPCLQNLCGALAMLVQRGGSTAVDTRSAYVTLPRSHRPSGSSDLVLGCIIL
ncbi:hypothetical protein BDP27DRAFT_1317340, partial [Rhodocollybia butyracea]